jgi:hypothetical protein
VTVSDAPVSDIGVAVAGMKRRAEIVNLLPDGAVAVELGVAEGFFSEILLKSEKIGFLYSIDMYAGDRGHNVVQYGNAFKRLDKFRTRSALIKMKFDEALPLFADHVFDLVYVDGYAHNGEEGGRTFEEWLPKVKPGGLLAGHDYKPKYPLVMEAVDAFVARHGFDMHLINDTSNADWNYGSPSWVVRV